MAAHEGPKRQEELTASRVDQYGKRIVYKQRFTVGTDLRETDRVREGITDASMLFYDAPDEQIEKIFALAADENITPMKAHQMLQGILLQLGHISVLKQQKLIDTMLINEGIPPLIQKQLRYLNISQDGDKFARMSAARDPDIMIELLYVLSDDPSFEVRQEVARRDDLTSELEVKLARDESINVRYEIACKSNINQEVIEILRYDKDEGIRKQIARKLPEK